MIVPIATAIIAASMPDSSGMRLADIELFTSASVIDLEQCVVRRVGGGFNRVVVIDMIDGKAVDLTLGIQAENALTFEFHDDGIRRRLTIKYRHPFSNGAATRQLRGAARHCIPEMKGIK